MERILISSCLIGDKTRYDGRSNYHPLVKRLMEKYDLIPFCPEVEGGLPIPRNPSERIKDKVIMNNGKDVTNNYKKGAEKALAICKALNIRIAILKERSPACGSHEIYDGTFSHTTKKGMGVAAELLTKKGIKVISENEIEAFLNK
jgi:uncharacterized protein YbbK (DUF523 family)